MNHLKTILGAHLDCVAANFPFAADDARNTRDTAFISCDLIDGEIQPANAEEIHETLELIQSTAGDWCANGSTLAESEMCETLRNFKSTLESLNAV